MFRPEAGLPEEVVIMSNRSAIRRTNTAVLWGLVLLAGLTGAWAQESAEAQKAAAIKQSLQRSMAALRSYEWIETVTVKVDGDQKSRKENRCYYGADGKQQKVAVEGQSSESHMPPGLRGRIARRKAAAMEEYIQAALALVKEYVPPDPARLEAVKGQGAQTTQVLDNASRLRAEFADYLKPGDKLSVDVDPKADRVLGISVSTYLEDDPEDAVSLQVSFGTFQDGTSYPAKVELKGESKDLDVVIENSGYRKTGG